MTDDLKSVTAWNNKKHFVQYIVGQKVYSPKGCNGLQAFGSVREMTDYVLDREGHKVRVFLAEAEPVDYRDIETFRFCGIIYDTVYCKWIKLIKELT